jgi:hypothetical protein
MNPYLRTSALLLFVLVPGVAGAEVKIAPADRVENRPPGRCGWCAVETLARHHKIKALYGLTEDNPTGADPEDLEEALIAAGVKYHIQYPGSNSTKILREAIKEGRGAAIGFRELFPGAGGHIVTLVDFGPKVARVIDSSDPGYRVRTMPVQQFLHWWDGFALVLEKDRPKKKGKKKAGSR